MPLKKLALMAVLTAAALIVFVLEALIPLPIPVPGAKLGLANAVTLFALFFGRGTAAKGDDAKGGAVRGGSARGGAGQGADKPVTDSGGASAVKGAALSTADAFMILAARIILGALVTGRMIAFVYSISGGLLGFAAQAVMSRFVTDRQIWACGAVGAVFHNAGQIFAAMLITGSPAIAAYLPMLVILGIVAGSVTGAAAQFAAGRLARAFL